MEIERRFIFERKFRSELVEEESLIPGCCCFRVMEEANFIYKNLVIRFTFRRFSAGLGLHIRQIDCLAGVPEIY